MGGSGLTRRRFLAGAAGVTAGGLLASCGGASAPATAAPTAAATAAVAKTSGPPKVSAQTKAAVSHLKALISTAPWAVGDAKGYFKDVGLTQELTEFTGGGDTVRGLLQAGNNYALTTPSATALAFNQGQPVRIIGGGFGGTTIVFVSKKAGGAKDVKELAGKKIGYSAAGSATEFVIKRTLKDAGITANLVATGGVGESLTALRNNVVDVAWTPYPQPQRFPDEFQIVFVAAKTVPNFAEFIISTTADYADKNPEVLRAFLYAFGQSMDFIRASPDEAGAIWAKVVNYPPAQVAAAMKEIPTDAWSIKIAPQMLKVIEDSMIEFKQVPGPIDWKKLVIQDFLPADQRTTI